MKIYIFTSFVPQIMQLFQALETFNRKPQGRSVVRKVGDAYEVLGLLEEKKKLLEKYDSLFSETSDQTSQKSQKSKRVKGKKNKTGMLLLMILISEIRVLDLVMFVAMNGSFSLLAKLSTTNLMLQLFCWYVFSLNL